MRVLVIVFLCVIVCVSARNSLRVCDCVCVSVRNSVSACDCVCEGKEKCVCAPTFTILIRNVQKNVFYHEPQS